MSALLELRNVSVDYVTANGNVRAVDDVSLDIADNTILGIAGESGSGKSTLAQAVLRLLPPPGVIVGGHAYFGGHDLFDLDAANLRRLRWRELAFVYQSAMNALNPVMTVEAQLADVLRAHAFGSRATMRARMVEVLSWVGIEAERLSSYPHQLSGGMRQRVGIAMALLLGPKLLVLDEPTTALDVLVQREILERLLTLKTQLGLTVVIVSHDLLMLTSFCDRVAIMTHGRVVEIGAAEQVRNNGAHPYTRALMAAFPKL